MCSSTEQPDTYSSYIICNCAALEAVSELLNQMQFIVFLVLLCGKSQLDDSNAAYIFALIFHSF